MQLSRYENSSAPLVPIGLRGLGSAQSAQTKATIESIAATGASSAAATLAYLYPATFGGPVGIAIAGIIAIGVVVAQMFKGCGQTCVQASNIADQVGAQLVQMFNTYMSSPVHYQSMQTAYLQQWDAFWQALTQACSDPNLQDAGKRCISDRQQGACHYHTSPGGWQKDSSGKWIYVAPGQDGSGNTCWNWFVGTRDPVANDPTIIPDPTPTQTVGDAASTILSNVTGGSGAGIPPMLLLGGVALLGFMFMSMQGEGHKGRYR